MKKPNVGSEFKRINDSVDGVDNKGNKYTDIKEGYRKFPFEDNSIDEIACYEVLKHVGFEKIIRINRRC